jgi:hypothetical protein
MTIAIYAPAVSKRDKFPPRPFLASMAGELILVHAQITADSFRGINLSTGVLYDDLRVGLHNVLDEGDEIVLKQSN